MSNEINKLTEEQEAKLKQFDPAKPLIINTVEIPGLEDKVGRFVFKRPTVKDNLEIGVRYSAKKRKEELDAFYANLAYILATFEVVCLEKPSGYEFENEFDADILFGLHGRYTEWLEFFRLNVQKSKEAASKAVSQ